MDGYDWNLFIEILERDYGGEMPDYIQFKDESGIWVKRKTQKASLDELATALVNIEEEIEYLHSIKKMLYQVHRRTRRTFQSGLLIVHDVILGNSEEDLGYGSQSDPAEKEKKYCRGSDT